MKSSINLLAIAAVALCAAQANAQTTRTWYFPDGRIAAVLHFDADGFRNLSEVYGPRGTKGEVSVYGASRGGGRNCRWGSAWFNGSSLRYGCLTGSFIYDSFNLVVFGSAEGWQKHGEIRHYDINGQRWSWYARGFNGDKNYDNPSVEEVVITDANGKTVGDFVTAPDGNFMDNMFRALPVEKRPRYYLTTSSGGLNAAHFVPVVGNRVIPPGTMPAPCACLPP